MNKPQGPRKPCTACGRSLFLSAFALHPTTADRHAARCKMCVTVLKSVEAAGGFDRYEHELLVRLKDKQTDTDRLMEKYHRTYMRLEHLRRLMKAAESGQMA